MRVHLRIDLPADGSIAADSRCGVFVTGRAHALRGELQRYDVVLVLDTSRSTIDPAGADINGNGVVGRKRLGHLGAIFGADSSDPGDSILAAEVAAARQLLGLSGAISRTDPEAEKIVFFFTDGQPTLPHEGVGAEANNVRAVLRGAAVCAPTHSQSAPSARRPDRHGGDGEPYQWPLHPAVPSRGSRGSHARGELREHRRDGALERHHR